jgi:hypothetical protein
MKELPVDVLELFLSMMADDFSDASISSIWVWSSKCKIPFFPFHSIMKFANIYICYEFNIYVHIVSGIEEKKSHWKNLTFKFSVFILSQT